VWCCFPLANAVAFRKSTWALLGSMQLAPRDLIQLVPGCTVQADCSLSNGSLLDKSKLTEQTNFVRAGPGHLITAGTVAADGVGTAVVRFTRFDTFTGQGAGLLHSLARDLTRPLVQRAYLAVCLITVVILATMGVVLYSVFTGPKHFSSGAVAMEVMSFSVTCAPLALDVETVQAVSYGADVAVTRAKTTVLRLGALLSLASLDVLVMDKSGTLTTSVYHVAATLHSFSVLYPSRDSLVQLMALAMKWREPSPQAMWRRCCAVLTLACVISICGLPTSNTTTSTAHRPCCGRTTRRCCV
jgi:P-type E1-E2 ATPase